MANDDAYVTLDGRHMDPEKRGSSDTYDYSLSDTDSCSREVSGSHVPMLQSDASPSRRAAAYSYALPRRRFTRYFTLFIASSLIIFILTLTRLKFVSDRDVQLGVNKAVQKPPTWEEFPFLKRYYGGLRDLVQPNLSKPEYPDPNNNTLQKSTAKALGQQQKEPVDITRRNLDPTGDKFNPYPDYESQEYKDDHQPMVECFLDQGNTVKIPLLYAHNGLPRGFPAPVMGSHDLLGLRDDVCFDRYGRLGPYGLGYSRKYGGSGAGMEGDGHTDGPKQVWGDQLEINYRSVKWAEVQERCEYNNRFRFEARPKSLNHFFTSMAIGGPNKETPVFKSGETRPAGKDGLSKGSGPEERQAELERVDSNKKLLHRTAVIIRTWWDYEYDSEDLFYLRALVNELSIQSGGEYTVHFLIHVKDDNMQIWSDAETYQRVLDEALPEEFRGMGTLWSERQMNLIYGGLEDSFFRDLPVHGAYRSTYMPVQYFAHMHPEYEHFWHWEMDVRYTGHFYHLFERVREWATRQPRKGLWERNARFYIPSEHGSWEDFTQMVRVQTEHGTAHQSNMYSKMGKDPKTPAEAKDRPETPVWGPLPPTGRGESSETLYDYIPPSSYAQDNYKWGKGEEADFITFNPLFDPDRTSWLLAEDVTGYNTTEGFPPRRVAIITASRLSRHLLETMHRETALKRHTMFSEMWPGSVALHYGMKAVYVPHPVYIDRRWPTSYLAAIFNNGRNGASGGARTSVFSDERQHNFLGTSWYYHAGFPGHIWKRWLGYKVDNSGGEEEEMAGEGRMCLPGMLLHPVKQVDLIYEHQRGE